MINNKDKNHLYVRHLTAGYGGSPVVSDISFDAAPGKVCVLLGLNGSGKTTLLKGICGLLPVTGGACLYNKTDITKLSEKRRAQYISFIPQRHSKLIGVTVLDAVLMGLNARLGVFEQASENDKEQAVRALETMKIPHLARNDFSRLSEGQKQLVILSRMLLQNTPVILMDEPDSALDFINRKMMLQKTRELAQSRNRVCVITLHDPNLAISYCDKLVLLDKGRVTGSLSVDGAGQNEINGFLSAIYGDYL